MSETLSRRMFPRVRAQEFWILGRLKSEDTIQVLGSYLNDDEFRWPRKGADYDYGPPNSTLAAIALGELGLPDAPVTSSYPKAYSHADVLLWKEWWAKRVSKQKSLDTFDSTIAPEASTQEVKEYQQISMDNKIASWKWFVVLILMATLAILSYLYIKKKN